VNVDALFKLQSEGKKVFPQPEILKIVQDKGLQKNFIARITSLLLLSSFRILPNKMNVLKYHLYKNQEQEVMTVREYSWRI
jgi:5-(carboxyamino)imidazole ribonucleotide synthase